jgi:hypothetical protein
LRFIAAWLWLAAGAAGAPSYRVSGVLVNSVSGTPLANARLTLAATPERTQGRVVLSANDGRFVFEGVPAGKYALTAERRGYVPKSYGQGTGRAGVAVLTGPAEDTEHIVFRLPPGAAIGGRVLDEAGEPVKEALVQLLFSTTVYGRRRAVPLAFYWTDDGGEYRFSGLPEGSYYLAVSGQPWYAGRYRFSPGIGGVAYAPQFFPGVADPKAAAPLLLKAGQEVAAGFSLVPTVGGTLEVVVPGPGTARLSLVREWLDGNDYFVATADGGSARFTAVPPGSYTVAAAKFRRQRVQVGAGDTQITMVPDEEIAIAGEARFDKPSPRAEDLRIALQDRQERVVSRRTLGPGGIFSFRAVGAGEYRVVLENARCCYLDSVSADGAAVENGALNLSRGGLVKLSVAVRTDGGTVEGKVYRQDRPLAGAFVVLAPRDEKPRNTDYRLFVSDSDGSFELEGIRPGEYDLFVGPDGPDLEYANPEVVKPLRARGNRLRVEAGGRQVVRLDVSP